MVLPEEEDTIQAEKEGPMRLSFNWFCHREEVPVACIACLLLGKGAFLTTMSRRVIVS